MKEIFRLCMVLTVIAAISAGVLAFVNQETAEPIAKAELEEKMAAVRAILPEFDNEPDKDMVTIKMENGEEVEIYRGRKDGGIVGVAFEVVAPDGYSGDIRFMVGVNIDGVVQGIAILKHLETPGLGAKITEADFKDRYRGKSLGDPENWAVTKDGGTFVPITGATISSRAITKATHKGLEFFKQNRSEIIAEKDKGGDQQR
ncbi:MAG: RnfABCDGE type electron transport complex subunit G [Candidatus Krumholzibacteriota bacterium]|nr:RnfABCDGE type electron transport complex subunit G [Candidatus Krumholzibacteriota bacterium]